MSEISNVGVIGLGSMGWGAAMALIECGYSVYGTDLKADTLDSFTDNQGVSCASPAALAEFAEVILVFVVSDKQAEQALFGDKGAVAAAAPGTLFILNTTMASNAVLRIAEKLRAAEMRVIDAPVNGGAERALRGDLMVMVSGEQKDIERASPVLDAIGARVLELGEQVGQASQIKMINQLLAGIHIAATAEAMALASSVGVDLHAMYRVISNSTGSSCMFEERGQQIISGNYKLRSSVDIILKDLEIADSDAAAHDVTLPLSRAVLELFSSAHDAGYGDKDGSIVAEVLAQQSAIELPGRNQRD